MGSFRAAVSYENSEDAFPRSNIEYRLPHNAIDNFEAIGSVETRVNRKFKSEVRFLYQSFYRDYYDHDYHFDLAHAPREEGSQYTGEASLYGWMRDDLFVRAFGGVKGEESILGDGLYFDVLMSYGRPTGNPRYDNTSLYWSYDRNPVYDENDSCIYNCGDDGHVYENFYRYQQHDWYLGMSADKKLGERTLLSTGLQYSRGTYRQYHHLYPTNVYQENGNYNGSAFLDVVRIGYDSLGKETSDNFRYGSLPSPSQFLFDLHLEHLAERFFVRGGWHVGIYDYNTIKVKNQANPLDPANTYFDDDPTNDSLAFRLDAGDLEETGYRQYTDYTFAGGVHVTPNATIYVSQGISHQLPSYSQIYFDPDYFEYKVLAGGYFYPMANPDLTPIRFERTTVGTTIRLFGAGLNLEYQRERISDWIVVVTQPALPRSYSVPKNSEESERDRFSAILSFGDNGPLECQLAYALRRDDHNFEGAENSAIAWTVSDFPDPNVQKFTDHNLAAHLSIDPSRLNLAEGGVSSFVSRFRVDLSAAFRSGVRYTPTKIYPEVTMVGYSPVVLRPPLSGTSRDFLEINAAVTARLAKVGSTRFAVRLEVLNLLDRDNWRSVYTGTGLPDDTRWLETSEGQEFINYNDTPDQTGLNGEQKYLLKENNPLNFGRPRIVRIMAQLTF
jgi:hypothetical protein